MEANSGQGSADQYPPPSLAHDVAAERPAAAAAALEQEPAQVVGPSLRERRLRFRRAASRQAVDQRSRKVDGSPAALGFFEERAHPPECRMRSEPAVLEQTARLAVQSHLPGGPSTQHRSTSPLTAYGPTKASAEVAVHPHAKPACVFGAGPRSCPDLPLFR